MAFEKLLGSAESLMSQMRRNGFSDSYRTEVMTEIRWLSRRGRECESLEEACLIRCGELGTSGTVRKARAIFGRSRADMWCKKGWVTGTAISVPN